MTEFRYDAEHRLVASVDSDGYRTSYSYDSIDRLRSVRTPDNERTTFTYVDSLTTRRTEPNNAHTTLVFNALRQLERVIEPNGEVWNGSSQRVVHERGTQPMARGYNCASLRRVSSDGKERDGTSPFRLSFQSGPRGEAT